MKIQLFEIISILGIVQGLLLSILLLFKKKNKAANYFLSALITLVSLILFYNILTNNGYLNQYYSLEVYMNSIVFLFPPLHFLYAIFLLTPLKKMRLGDLKQFSMFIIINVVYLPIYFKNETALSIYQQISRNNINNLVSSVYSIIVMFFVLRLLAGHSKRIKLNFSYLEKINLNWLKVITLLIIIFDILFVILLYIPQILDFDPSIPNTILILLSVLLIYITSIFGFRQPEIFKAYAHPVEPVKYKTSGLTEKKAIEIEKKLIEILSSKKPYLNEDLNINELADMLNITSAYLSQVINENLGFNFYNLINKYRIEEAKNLIESSRYASLKLETIAYDTGFKSKSTFNAAFKKFTNLTPSQFKMQIKNYPETES